MRWIGRAAALGGIHLVVGCSLFLITPGLARAQWSSGGTWTNAYTGRTFNNPTSCLLDTMIMQAGQRQMLITALRRQAKKKAGASAAASPSAETPAATVAAATSAAASPSTTFKPSKEYATLPKVADQLGRNAAERAALMQLLRDGLASYEREAANDHRPYDLAEAMAFYIALNYGVLHDGVMPDDKQTEGLYQSVHAGLLGVPAIQQATDSQKQALYEALVGIGVFTLAGYQQGIQEKKPATCQTFHDLAAMNLRDLLSLPAERLRLTGEGMLQFVPASKGG